MSQKEFGNYIEFYYNEEGNFIAEIHKQGKHRLVRSPVNVEKLIKICEKYGYRIDREGIIEKNSLPISREYDDYAEKRNKKIKRLRVIGNILTNMSLKKKDKTIGKRVVVFTLAGIIAASIGIGAANNKNQVDNPVAFQQEQAVDDQENTLDDHIIIVEDEFLPELPEDILNVNENIVQVNKELMEMVETEQFHFSYEDRTSRENIPNVKRYEDLFEKYANRYGIDKKLLMALAAQESCGEHYKNLGNGPAEGIMQIEKAVHIGSTISAYNFETGETDKITVTAENLKDLETNIQIGTMILRSCIEKKNYNIPLSLQTYNFGYGNIEKVLTICCQKENTDKMEIINNPTNNNWLRYRSALNIGDPQYVEHVFSFLENNTELTVKKRNGELVTISIANDYQKENTPSL